MASQVQRQANLSRLPANLKPPTNCPCCNSVLVLQDAWPACPNFDCGMRVYGRLQKFVDVLDIKGAGEETLKGLALKGLCRTPADLYAITEAEFTQLDRKGTSHYRKFVDGLERAKTMRVPQFFASLDIEGEGTWENILQVPGIKTVEDVVSLAHSNPLGLRAVRVSEEKAREIASEIIRRGNEIRSLVSRIVIKKVGKKLDGKVICITGTLSRPRPQLVEMIQNEGGRVSDSVTSKVTHLVIDDLNSTSSKAKEARKKKVPMISEKDLMAMLT